MEGSSIFNESPSAMQEETVKMGMERCELTCTAEQKGHSKQRILTDYRPSRMKMQRAVRFKHVSWGICFQNVVTDSHLPLWK